MRRTLLGVCAGGAVFILSVPAFATPIALESWNYGDGTPVSVAGQTGGSGWETTAGWQVNATDFLAEVLDPGTQLTYTSGDGSITVAGGDRALRLSQGPGDTSVQMVDRGLATSLSAATDPEVYVSFLIRIGTGSIHNHDHFGTTVNNHSQKGMALATGYGYWVTGPTHWGGDEGEAVPGPSEDQTYFVVSRFWIDPTADNYDPTNPMYNRSWIWIDPNLGDAGTPQAEGQYTGPGDETVRSLIDIESATMCTHRLDPEDVIWLDEYNLGTTWADVIPEPTTLLLLGLGGAALLRRKR